ncbi:MAG: hypothetical protein J0I12_06675 [Candidatus Eremiobacteraeota bacterium]|nr:hypothetical protein [Candidatus Eremiobacteraeota bacterium]
MFHKLCLILLLWTGLCLADQQYLIDGDTFRHKGLGLSFRVPSGWGPDRVLSSDEGALIKLAAPTGRTSLVLILGKRKEGEARSLAEVEKEVATTIRGFHFTKTATRQLNNREIVIMNASASGGHRLHRLAVIPDQGQLALLWMQSNSETFPTYLPSFDAVVDSLVWENKGDLP